jgi:hypothetical protein
MFFRKLFIKGKKKKKTSAPTTMVVKFGAILSLAMRRTFAFKQSAKAYSSINATPLQK